MGSPLGRFTLLGRKRGTHVEFRRLGMHKRTGKLVWASSAYGKSLRAAKRLRLTFDDDAWQTVVAAAKRQGLSVKPVEASTLGERALAEAQQMLGLNIREHGANNRGEWVEKIIRANGGVPGEPWCGDFAAWCYRRAGSKAVTRSWAAVRLLGRLSGMRIVSKHALQQGDLVRFTFDHVGIFERYVLKDKVWHVVTIDGNTGLRDVSDGSGSEGVERKTRPLSLVADGVEVLR